MLAKHRVSEETVIKIFRDNRGVFLSKLLVKYLLSTIKSVQKWFLVIEKGAQTRVVVSPARGEMDAIVREIRSYRETGKSSLQSAAAAIACICLILHNFGLGTTCMCGPSQAKNEIEQLLKVPPE